MAWIHDGASFQNRKGVHEYYKPHHSQIKHHHDQFRWKQVNHKQIVCCNVHGLNEVSQYIEIKKAFFLKGCNQTKMLT